MRTISGLERHAFKLPRELWHVTITLHAAPWVTEAQWEILKQMQEQSVRHAVGNPKLGWGMTKR